MTALHLLAWLLGVVSALAAIVGVDTLADALVAARERRARRRLARRGRR